MNEKLGQYIKLIERFLQSQYFGKDYDTRLFEAARYSLLAGGKRLRPVLTLATAELCGGKLEAALPLACALEYVHSYSLIHDDLPCMDNDVLRRGKPTNHMEYGEATAILAGDSLLTDAFALIAAADLPSDRIAEAVRVLSKAAGSTGMVLGQAIDIAREGEELTLREISQLQTLKTGALFIASVELGAVSAGVGNKARQALVTYASRLGRAFQLRDDLLDVVGETENLGKSIGSDERKKKTTFVTVLTHEECRKQVEKLTEDAIAALAVFPYEDTEFLRLLAQSLVNRES